MYIVVTENSLEILTVKVNDLIREGWTPIGGVSQSENDTRYFWVQAMVKG